MVLLGLFYLNNVLVTPDNIKNLLSVHQFTIDNWCSMEFDPFGPSVKDLATRNMITRCTPSIFLPCMLLRRPHTMLLLLLWPPLRSSTVVSITLTSILYQGSLLLVV
jgi:hypothetical protein